MRTLFRFLVAHLVVMASAQQDDADKLETCNVVCNCNSGENAPPTPLQRINQGPPGKVGPKGEIGVTGPKGLKGDTGVKGEKGEEAEQLDISQILSAIGISCQDLKSRYGIKTSGYYLMMNEHDKTSVYNYCDFKVYEDVASCEQLFSTYNFSVDGFYMFARESANRSFEYCQLQNGFMGIYTCQAIQDRYRTNARNSGYYEFQRPDSAPFRVYCNFSQTPAATEVHHDRMIETKILSSCESDGCFSAAPDYDAKGEDLKEILKNSVSCRQYIKLRCHGVQLRRNDASWWVSRDGDKMTYWGGATRNGYCACGETNSCLDNSYKCNCDQNSESMFASDDGYLTDKSKLPLREVKVGDMGGGNEMAWYTIGKLECFGQLRSNLPRILDEILWKTF